MIHDAPNTQLKKVLWFRTDAIGDSILSSSMLPYIKEKLIDSLLIAVCQDRVADLYLESPYVDGVISYNVLRFLGNEVYRESVINKINLIQPDMIINSVFSRDWQNYYLTLNCHASVKIACEGDLCCFNHELKIEFDKYFTHFIRNNTEEKTELGRYRHFLHQFGIHSPKLMPKIWIAQADHDQAEKLYMSLNLDSDKTIVLFPSSSVYKKDYSHFKRILQALHGYTLLVLGNADNKELGDGLCETFSGRSFNLAGMTTLPQLAAIMKRARLYVGADSCGAHIACAVGLPNVVILGGGHFGRYFPYSSLTTAVCYPLNCYDCNWQCKHSRCHCIYDIRPDAVVGAIKYALHYPNKLLPTLYVQTSSLYHDSPTLLPLSKLADILDLNTVEIVEG